MDRKRLRGKIVERFGTQERFATEVLGISATSLSTKMSRSQWTLRQVAQIASALELSADEVWALFFADEVGSFLNKTEE